MARKDLLTLKDLPRREIEEILSLARSLKESGGGGSRPLLAGRILAMVFEKPSLRTRVTFEAGMLQLGGHTMNV